VPDLSTLNTNIVIFQFVGTNLTATNITSVVTTSSESLKVWGPMLVGLVAAFLAFTGQLILIWRQRQQSEKLNELTRKQLELSKSKEEREEIHRKLNTFYGPFKELRTQSKLLYRKFADSHRQAAKASGQKFRTLQHLLQGNFFQGQDAELLSQILKIDQELLKLIEAQSGVVDKPELQELLGKLGAHIRILQLACDGKLSGPTNLFTDIVFPLPIDGAIESAILRLQDRLRELNRLESQHALTHPSVVACANSTIDYYDSNAEPYAQKTMFIDVKHLHEAFVEHLPLWARILDAGCGAGRDTRHFIESGNIVISFDGSQGMVQKCLEYPHAYCVKLTFDEIDFKEEFDGVWACASLLHLRQHEAVRAVYKLTTALKPGGVLFISLKAGRGASQPDGRFFQYYEEDELKRLHESDVMLEQHTHWVSSSVGSEGGEQIQWHNLRLRRRSHS
jgi:hypothetical protein